MNFFDVLSLLGGLAMFLYGMRLMGDSLKENSSGTLKHVMEKVTDNAFKAFILGIAVTALIQSSTATIVITSGLVGAGILSLRQSLGIIVGANVGTTVTGQIIRLLDLNASETSVLRFFQPSTLAPIALIIGILLIMTGILKNSRSIGNIAIGFGILFSGLLNMTSAVNALQKSGIVEQVFSGLGDNPFLGYLTGAGVAFVLQSSSAAVGILQAFSAGSRGMKQKTVAKILGGAFAVFTVFVSFVSCGALQVNTINSAVSGFLGNTTVIPWIIALAVLVIDGLVIFGGVRKIADVTTYLTPIMAIIYLGFGLIILIMNITLIPTALWFIVKSAFTGDAVIGGVAGATMGVAIRRGVQRGVFSNEAGTGSSAMVHATAKVDVPVKQALYGIIEVFFDTFVICTFTALIIMVSGVWNSGVTDGTVLASTAFRQNLGGVGQVVIVISLILFCLSTVLGWYTYGESAFAFLFGSRRVKIYRLLHMVICGAGALISVQLLWDAADVCNGLMAIPNLFSLILFGGIVVKDTREFFAAYDKKRLDRT